MAGVVRTLSAFSRFDETLLLRGATGTGKSHLAAWCHARSARARGPFIVADLRSGADGLGDAALFGWKRGAFTGAVADSRGAVAQAEGGTLFIDEIDKLDLTAQGRLLRLLEERRYRAIGEERERTADVRFIVGTNADLEGAVSQGRFLRDLYYRVNVLPIEVPSLSGRRDEIRPWARRMLRIAGESGAVLSAAFNDAAEDLLEAQPWPGNLRHLHSVVVRALAFCLADTTDPAQADAPPCEVSERHVRRALSLDRSEPPGVEGSVKDALGTVSRAFVTEAQRRRRAQEPSLDLDLTEGLRGLVLQAARERIGETREAFSLFGLDQQLRGGNYLRTWRREVERSDELLAALGISRSAPSERGD
jgi:DNA-binding NtrC family response regulator